MISTLLRLKEHRRGRHQTACCTLTYPQGSAGSVAATGNQANESNQAEPQEIWLFAGNKVVEGAAVQAHMRNDQDKLSVVDIDTS